ncbi:MAG: SIS domain-containing protein, partial [Chitinophagales bacterium]
MNHNELACYAVYNESIVPVFLEMPNDDERIKKRFNISAQLLKECRTDVVRIAGLGKTFAEQIFFLLHLGDWVSYYAALSNNVNPVDIAIMDT